MTVCRAVNITQGLHRHLYNTHTDFLLVYFVVLFYFIIFYIARAFSYSVKGIIVLYKLYKQGYTTTYIHTSKHTHPNVHMYIQQPPKYLWHSFMPHRHNYNHTNTQPHLAYSRPHCKDNE